MNDAQVEGPGMLSARGVHKSYRSAEKSLNVLQNASFDVYKGELLGIVGASGAGKSTLLHILGGLDHPHKGTVEFEGDEIYTRGEAFLDRFRNTKVGFVFQFFNLLQDLSALENTMLPSLIRNDSEKEARKNAEDMLDRVGLKDRLTHKPGELSGGECQRVALARALANKPALLLADEPTGNLDSKSSDMLMDLIRELNSELNQTVVLVTHSQKIAQSLDRVLQLEDGKVHTIAKDLIL